mmetsp:Transcript_42771/g.103164  ORF Transcript_42771/g.103164 Transcript_42771/m.103164 type:complete len:90 (-) Transcript_42771:55-324(-)
MAAIALSAAAPHFGHATPSLSPVFRAVERAIRTFSGRSVAAERCCMAERRGAARSGGAEAASDERACKESRTKISFPLRDVGIKVLVEC